MHVGWAGVHFTLMGIALLALAAGTARKYASDRATGALHTYDPSGRTDPRLRVFVIVSWTLVGVLPISVLIWT